MNRDRVRAIDIALKILDCVETRSDLMTFLSADKGLMLFPVEQAEALGRLLIEHFGEEELNLAGIYLDKLPAEIGERCAGAVLINTTPNRYECDVNFDGSVTFLGKWMVVFLRLIQCLLSIIKQNGQSSVTMCEISAI